MDHLSENPVVFPGLLRVMGGSGGGKRPVELMVLSKEKLLKDE